MPGSLARQRLCRTVPVCPRLGLRETSHRPCRDLLNRNSRKNGFGTPAPARTLYLFLKVLGPVLNQRERFAGLFRSCRKREVPREEFAHITDPLMMKEILEDKTSYGDTFFVPVRARWRESWADENGDEVPALKDLHQGKIARWNPSTGIQCRGRGSGQSMRKCPIRTRSLA